MKAPQRLSVIALLVVTTGCATGKSGSANEFTPPARPNRAGVSRTPGSAGPASGSRAARTPTRSSSERSRAIEAATALIGERSIEVDGREYGPDCTALVHAAFDAAGHALPPTARAASDIHALAVARGALRHGTPRAGDVVFLADAPGGPPVHVGLVSRVEPDGTALVLHRLARGVVAIRVNTTWPDRDADPSTGRRVNDALVVDGKRVPAAKLVVGTAALLRG